MAGEHFQTLRAIFRPWYIKVGSVLATLGATVGIYASLQDQFPDRLPKLQDMVTMAHVLILPWWGWLLVLQAVLGYGLYDYVRRTIGSVHPADMPLSRYQDLTIHLGTFETAILERLKIVEQATKDTSAPELRAEVASMDDASYRLARFLFLRQQYRKFLKARGEVETAWAQLASHPLPHGSAAPSKTWKESIAKVNELIGETFRNSQIVLREFDPLVALAEVPGEQALPPEHRQKFRILYRQNEEVAKWLYGMQVSFSISLSTHKGKFLALGKEIRENY